MRRGDLHGDEGFTLVEVLVALAVTGLIVSTVTGLSWSIRRLEERAQRESAARENVIAADRVFRAVVSGAMPDLRKIARSGPVGASDGVTLMTLGLAILTFDRPRPLTLKVEKRIEGAALLAQWNDPATGAERQEVVLGGARSVTLSYFGAAMGKTPVWHGKWTNPQDLPTAVLLRIDMPELGSPIELIARTFNRMPAACPLMPYESRCGGEAVTSAEQIE